MYWLYVDGDQWCMCPRGELGFSRPLGIPATTPAGDVVATIKRAAPRLEVRVFLDE